MLVGSTPKYARWPVVPRSSMLKAHTRDMKDPAIYRRVVSQKKKPIIVVYRLRCVARRHVGGHGLVRRRTVPGGAWVLPCWPSSPSQFPPPLCCRAGPTWRRCRFCLRSFTPALQTTAGISRFSTDGTGHGRICRRSGRRCTQLPLPRQELISDKCVSSCDVLARIPRVAGKWESTESASCMEQRDWQQTPVHAAFDPC
jgi:hypothetical protein